MKMLIIGITCIGLVGLIGVMGWLAGSGRKSAHVRTPLEHWSKWSVPYDTTPRGWYFECGLVQYRTNLDSGLVEVRGVR